MIIGILWKIWIVVIVMLSILGLKEFFTREKKKVVDFREIGLFSRERNDDLKGYVQIQKKYTGSEPYNYVEVIENRNSQGLNIFGIIASGKSKTAEEFAMIYGTDEIEKLGYDKKTLIILSPTTHSNNGILDFRLGIPVIDISTRLPDVFSDTEAFVGAWKLALTEHIKNVGLMASQLPILARKIVKRNPKSWDDYFRVIQQLKRERNDDFDTRLLGIVEDMSQVLVGVANPIEFDFSKSVVLDFSKLGSAEAIKFYMELYARILHKREHDIVKDDNNVVLICDEAKLLMQHGTASILSHMILQARTYLRPILLFQNYADCPSDLHQVATEICFTQTDSESLKQIKERSPFLWECVTKLDAKNREFVDLGDNWHMPDGDLLPIYKLDITRLEQYKQSVIQKERENVYVPEPPQRVNNFVNDGNVWTPKKEDTGVETEIKKYDKVKTEKDILGVVEASPTGLFISEVLKQVGYEKRNDGNRGTAFRLIKKMAEPKVEKIRIKDYTSADARKHQLVFSKSNPQRAETQIHKRLKGDTKTILDENKIPYTEGLQNQGYDFSIEKENVEIEVESGLKHSIDEWNIKILKSEKLVITILCNEEDRVKYSDLECSKVGKTRLVLLSELLRTLKELRKNA